MKSVRPDDVFARLAQAAGVRLFTVTAHDMTAMLFRRVYTNDAAAYPVSGTKPLSLDDGWSRQVIVGRQCFVANDPEGFADFADQAQILALGCGAVANIPVVDDAGVVQGTVNLLDVAGHFTPARMAELEALVAAERDALVRAMAGAGF